MSELTIRPAEVSDAYAINVLVADERAEAYFNPESGVGAFWQAMLRHDMAGEEWVQDCANDIQKSRDDPKAFLYLVAEDSEGLQGTIYAYKTDTEQVIDRLFVRHDRHRRGIGKLLLSHFSEWADPTLPTTVSTVEYNLNAIGFYTHHGFDVVPDWEDYWEQYSAKIRTIMMKKQPLQGVTQ